VAAVSDAPPAPGWQVSCEWHERGLATHQSEVFVDFDEAARLFDVECATPHAGREVTIRLLEFQRLGVMWQSARDIAVWHPADPLGPWTEEGRLNSDEAVRPVGAGMLRQIHDQGKRGVS
jgi:hypothetical protein